MYIWGFFSINKFHFSLKDFPLITLLQTASKREVFIGKIAVKISDVLCYCFLILLKIDSVGTCCQISFPSLKHSVFPEELLLKLMITRYGDPFLGWLISFFKEKSLGVLCYFVQECLIISDS